MHRSPLLAGTHSPRDGVEHTIAGQTTVDMQPAATNCALILSSSVLSVTKVGQQTSAEVTSCVHCTTVKSERHILACLNAVANAAASSLQL
jgi:hypothetical protein